MVSDGKKRNSVVDDMGEVKIMVGFDGEGYMPYESLNFLIRGYFWGVGENGVRVWLVGLKIGFAKRCNSFCQGLAGME